MHFDREVVYSYTSHIWVVPSTHDAKGPVGAKARGGRSGDKLREFVGY